MGTEGRTRQPFMTKRTCFWVVVLMLGGAMINLAVAWGCDYYNTRLFLDSPFGYVPDRMPVRGFPLPSLSDEQVIWWNEWLPLSMTPISPEFEINTLFYAATLWLLLAAPFAWRRRRRIRRGLCPKCAYDLPGSPPGADATACPECGVAVLAQPQRGVPTTAQGNALGDDRAVSAKP